MTSPLYEKIDNAISDCLFQFTIGELVEQAKRLNVYSSSIYALKSLYFHKVVSAAESMLGPKWQTTLDACPDLIKTIVDNVHNKFKGG